MRRLMLLARPLWPSLAGASLLRILSLGSGMVLALLGAWAVARVVEGPGPGGEFWALFVAVALVKALCRYAEQLAGHAVAFRLLATMRSRAFRTLEGLAPAFPDRDVSGEVVAQLTADVDKVEVFYAHTVGPVAALLVLGPAAAVGAGLLGGLGAALTVGLTLGLVGFGFPALGYLLARRPADDLRGLAAETHGKVQENLRGAEQIALLGAGKQRLAEVADLDLRRSRLEARLARAGALKDGLIEAAIFTGILGLALGAWAWGWSLETGLEVVALAAASMAPALAVGRAFDDLPETLAAARRYFALADRVNPVVFPARTEPPLAGDRNLSVTFQEVAFGYQGGPGRPPVLEGFSLRVPAGSRLCLYGPSGTGKSTLLGLVARFHDPDRGRVLIGGRPVSELSEDDLRRSVAFLGQAPFFFDGTVADNLRTLVPQASDSLLEGALDRARFLPGQTGRLDRSVGVRGSLLSGGERKRLALARLLLQDAPVVILDEAFSSLDRKTRDEVRADVLAALEGRTILEASHEPEDQAGADLAVHLAPLGAPNQEVNHAVLV